MSSPKYRMRLDLNVLQHLGLNLYSNVAAVLSEVVANSWDADASSVSIHLDEKIGSIEIHDSGRGMTVEDANSRYLTVGYEKRKHEGTRSPNGRILMGRKGIGKLSLFSIADTVEVASVRDGELHGFRMDVSDIEKATKSHMDYFPAPLETDCLPKLTVGTRIQLTQLRRRATAQTVVALRKRIARRFSVIGPTFSVEINGVPVSVADRDDFSKLQFIWEFAESELVPASQVPSVTRRRTLTPTVSAPPHAFKISGWIGSVRKPKDLETVDSGNLNSVVLLARGRLIQEDILDKLNIGGLYTKYLTGQIDADFLDSDNEPDIATSDRQRVIEDDQRYQSLIASVVAALGKIEGDWSAWRSEIGEKDAVDRYPRIGSWIEALPQTARASARRVIGSIQGLAIDDEEKRRELLRHGLMAFERLRLQDSSERLAAALSTEAEELIPIILEQDQLESALYLDIVRGRLSVISNFSGLVDGNAKEKVLQQLLFDHLWLLDPSWERAAGSERLEERVRTAFEGVDAQLTVEERTGRVDIKYRTTAGKHLIIELKRHSVVPSAYDLAKQGLKYVNATKKLLHEAGRPHEPVELVCVIGSQMKESDATALEVLKTVPGRYTTYERLIEGAMAAYGDYLRAKRKVNAIEALLETDCPVS